MSASGLMRWGDGPKTFEEYEQRALAFERGNVPVSDLKRILKEVGVRGYSRMRRDELIEAVREHPEAAEALERLAHDRCRHYRWVVARGIAGSYGELADIESAAGVTPDLSGPSRGKYACWDDVRRVYAAAAEAGRRLYASVRVASSDGRALGAVLAALEDAGATVSGQYESRWDNGLTALYFDVAIGG